MRYIEIHILIEQGLQNIDSFIYEDMLPEELDLHINDRLYEHIKRVARASEGKGLQDYQQKVDSIRPFQVKGHEIPNDDNEEITDFEFGKRVNLPEDYLYLVKSRSYYNCDIDIDGKKVTDLTPQEKIIVKTLRNRKVDEEETDMMVNNSLYYLPDVTPISAISGNGLFVYNKKINKVSLDYIKKPLKFELTEDNKEDEYPVPDEIMYDVVRDTVEYLSKLTESSRNKVQYIASENIENKNL